MTFSLKTAIPILSFSLLFFLTSCSDNEINTPNSPADSTASDSPSSDSTSNQDLDTDTPEPRGDSDSETGGTLDSDSGNDSSQDPSDSDDDGAPDETDVCPNDAADNCLDNEAGDFDGDGLVNGDESNGCENDPWSECAQIISQLNEIFEQITEETPDATTDNWWYGQMKNGEKDCEEVVRDHVRIWNEQEKNATNQKASEDYYYICGWKAIAAINDTEPVFDFDGDGCLPSVGFSQIGEKSGGLKPTGSLTGGCRADNFLSSAHTLHRYACINDNNIEYCGHFYALYFQKDQITNLGGGHRHDWEYAAVWTRNGVVTHGSASAHGDLDTRDATGLAFEGRHLKVVYHKDGALTHAFRFAATDEPAENPYLRFVTPPIVSWYELTADELTNDQMRERLNSFDYGDASIPCKDSNFQANLNEFRPTDYPEFTQQSIEDSKPIL